MERAKAVALDVLKVAALGLVAGAVIALVFFSGGALIGGGVADGVETSRNALFVVAAVLLFIVAGMILIKGKRAEPSFAENGWRKHFDVIGPKVALGVLAVTVAAWAVVMDYVQFYLF